MQTKECIYCLYKFKRNTDNGDPACLAFPLGIPVEIQTGDISHTESYPGDKGYRFKEYKIHFKEKEK